MHRGLARRLPRLRRPPSRWRLMSRWPNSPQPLTELPSRPAVPSPRRPAPRSQRAHRHSAGAFLRGAHLALLGRCLRRLHSSRRRPDPVPRSGASWACRCSASCVGVLGGMEVLGRARSELRFRWGRQSRSNLRLLRGFGLRRGFGHGGGFDIGRGVGRGRGFGPFSASVCVGLSDTAEASASLAATAAFEQRGLLGHQSVESGHRGRAFHHRGQLVEAGQPRSSRNWRVVAYSAGRPAVSPCLDALDPAAVLQRLDDLRG